MKPKRNIRKYISLMVLTLLLLFSVLIFINYLLKRPDVQHYIIKDVCNRLGMDIEAEKMELDILGAVGVNLQEVKINYRGTNRSIEAVSLNFRFSKWRILTGDFMPVSADIRHPVIRLDETDVMAFIRKEKKGPFDISSLFTGGFKLLEMKDGEILVEGPSTIWVKGLFIRVEHASSESNTFKISAKSDVGYKGKKSGINIQGTADIDPLDIRESHLKITLKTNGSPLEWIPWPVKHVKMKKGLMDSILNISGSTAKGLNLNGTIKVKTAHFTLIHKQRSKSFEVPSLNCTLNASLKEKIIEVASLNMKNMDLDLDLSSTIDLRNMDNPYFRFRAKSAFMPIEIARRFFPFHITSPWLEERLFPLFEQGRARMDELLLQGTSDQFRHFSDEKNSSLLGLTVTCESFTLANMGIQMPVSGVSGTVEIRENNLAVKGLTGVFGTSKVNNASVEVKGLTSPIPVFTIPVDGDFDIQELLTHRYLEVIPETARAKIDEFSEISGRLSTKIVIGYRKDWKSPRILKGDFQFTDTIYHKKFLELPLLFDRIAFHFSEDETGSFEGNGLFGDMPFDVSGSTRISEGKLVFTGAEISGLADMHRLINAGLGPDKFPFTFRKGIPVKVTVKKEKDDYRYTGTIDTKNLVMESGVLLINAVGRGNNISFDISETDNTRLTINNIEIRLGKSLIDLSGAYNLSDRRLNNLKIMTQDMSVEDLEIKTRGKKNTFTGWIGCKLELSFPEKGKGVQFTGNVTGKGLSLARGLFPVAISDLAFYIDLAGEKGFINQWDMKLDGHPINLKGMLHGWDKVRAELLVTSEYMDLTRIIMDSDNINPGYSSKLFNTPDMHLIINASGGVWRKLTFSRLNTEMDISDQDISMNKLSAELERGKISLKGTVARGESGSVDIEGRVTLDNQPIDKLLADTGFNDIGIKGTLALDSSIKIKGPKENGIVKNLSGDIENLTVTNGLLKNSMVFLKILDTLNIPDKFTDRPPDMKEEGFYFHSLQGKGLIDKGVLKTDEFVMKSPAFNAVGSGEENLGLKTHNIRLLVQPLGNLDYILSHIPIVGRILVEDNETFFTVGYDITGPWGKPKMDIVPTENLKGLIGVFKRALLTPYRIIENIGNAAKEMSKTAPDNKGEGEKKEEAKPQPADK